MVVITLLLILPSKQDEIVMSVVISFGYYSFGYHSSGSVAMLGKYITSAKTMNTSWHTRLNLGLGVEKTCRKFDVPVIPISHTNRSMKYTVPHNGGRIFLRALLYPEEERCEHPFDFMRLPVQLQSMSNDVQDVACPAAIGNTKRNCIPKI